MCTGVVDVHATQLGGVESLKGRLPSVYNLDRVAHPWLFPSLGLENSRSLHSFCVESSKKQLPRMTRPLRGGMCPLARAHEPCGPEIAGDFGGTARMPVIGCPRMSLDLIPRLFFSTIIMPKDPAAKEGDAPKGPNVRRINPGGSSHTQFGGGGDDDNDFMRRGSNIRSTSDLKHFEVVRMVRSLGQKLGDRQLVLLSRRMDSVMRSESGVSADIFAKIKTMISDMISTMSENLQAEATKKAYCDAEMGKASDKKASKDSDIQTVSTRIDAAASKSTSLKKQVVAIKAELSTLAETEANMTKIRQEEKSMFQQNEPETVKGMEGVKSALRTLRDFYKSSGVQVTSGERKGTATGVIGRLEDVEADMAMSLSQMRSAEKTAELNFQKDSQDMKLEKSQKEKDVSYKTAEAQRLDSELNSLNSDSESLQTEMGALLDFIKSLEAECLVTPESFAEKQAKKQQEIAGLKEALTALDATAEPALLQRHARALRGQAVLKA
ncbi:unnamed protein product [Effrenium voratum]|nr:unnamed protein product [Effrenium voratum]